MARQEAYEALKAKVDTLKADLPCISFGYLGNYERWGDDTHWYIFLPHFGRIGTYSDAYGLGPGKQADIFEQALANWDAIEIHVRKMYAADQHRIGLVHLRSGLIVDGAGQLLGLGINPPPKFDNAELAADYLRSHNIPAVLMRS